MLQIGCGLQSGEEVLGDYSAGYPPYDVSVECLTVCSNDMAFIF